MDSAISSYILCVIEDNRDLAISKAELFRRLHDESYGGSFLSIQYAFTSIDESMERIKKELLGDS